ncbi:MAG: alpha/beta hydrolase [Pseudomonadota bacterium]|nr:alpha/beta hydrolase [Pseudomonadota bacterium]
MFEQLDKQVYQQIDNADQTLVNRYHRGSRMDPTSYPQNWNRTFELIPEHPVGGVLLLHGLSDSPYSLRSWGKKLYELGYYVVGLRLPGHGTSPSGLVTVKWQDWAAAVRVAASHIEARIGQNKPFYLFGYSNGAALAVEYALAVLEGEDLARPDALVLFSPAVGVTGIAALAIWQSRIGHLAGLEKLQWNDIQAEFDPYKYNSFAVNAGDQIYRLTGNISERLGALATGDGLTDFPRLLAFASVVDATIPPHSLIDNLLSRLAPEGHELVLFDVNRNTESEALMKPDFAAQVERSLKASHQTFDLTVVTNAAADTDRVKTRHLPAGSDTVTDTPLDLSWPEQVFSLSHVALPFPPDDPIYGAESEEDGHPWISLGRMDVRGERGLLLFPDNYFMRLRYNPFHAYIAKRIEELADGAINKSEEIPQ